LLRYPDLVFASPYGKWSIKKTFYYSRNAPIGGMYDFTRGLIGNRGHTFLYVYQKPESRNIPGKATGEFIGLHTPYIRTVLFACSTIHKRIPFRFHCLNNTAEFGKSKRDAPIR